MGQQEVYDFLKKNRNMWFTSKEISKEVYGIYETKTSVNSCLRRLRKNRFVEWKQDKRGVYSYRYQAVYTFSPINDYLVEKNV